MKVSPKLNIDQEFINELVDQSDNPPGGDSTLGYFYKAILTLILENQSFSEFLKKIKAKRVKITNKHLVNLLFRAYQYIKFEHNDIGYKNFKSAEIWLRELNIFFENKKNFNKYKRILGKFSTTTTIYQRYAGPYFIISSMFNGIPVAIADLGCGGNYGLRGIELQEHFSKIDDQTKNQIVIKMLRHPINIESGLAVDKEDPDSADVTDWRLACSFYPKELSQLDNVKVFEKRLRRSKKIQFVRADLVVFDWLPKRSVDVVILSTILYQLKTDEQIELLKKSKLLLRPNGILIVQDFAAKDKDNLKHLDFNQSWFGTEYGYRTFITSAASNWNFLEVLKWNNGRCSAVIEGEDFDKIYFEPYLSSSKAALAHSAS